MIDAGHMVDQRGLVAGGGFRAVGNCDAVAATGHLGGQVHLLHHFALVGRDGERLYRPPIHRDFDLPRTGIAQGPIGPGRPGL